MLFINLVGFIVNTFGCFFFLMLNKYTFSSVLLCFMLLTFWNIKNELKNMISSELERIINERQN